jgi:hypothetical protein
MDLQPLVLQVNCWRRTDPRAGLSGFTPRNLLPSSLQANIDQLSGNNALWQSFAASNRYMGVNEYAGLFSHYVRKRYYSRNCRLFNIPPPSDFAFLETLTRHTLLAFNACWKFSSNPTMGISEALSRIQAIPFRPGPLWRQTHPVMVPLQGLQLFLLNPANCSLLV